MEGIPNALRQRLQWFLFLRIGLMACLLILTIILYSHYGSTATLSNWLVFGAIAFSALVSLVSGLLLTRVQDLTLFSYTQLVFDTFFITGLILLTGGLDSPFPFLYHLAILNAALLLFRRGALIAASLAAICYGATVDLLYYGVLPPLGFSPPTFFLLYSSGAAHLTWRLVVHLSSFYVIGLLGSYLTQRLLQVETRLAEQDVVLGRLASLYQGVIQTLESGLLIIDASGGIEYANGPLGEIVGTESNLLVGRKAITVFPGLDDESSSNEAKEFPFQGANAEEHTLRATCLPLSDTYGNRLGALYSVQDITSVKALENELKEAHELEQTMTIDDTGSLDSFAGLVGRSRAMNEVYQLITKVAESATTVLITGESGTGKELVARAIHEKGPRVNRPFVPVNCAAIPDTLMESELFGSVKGAFTGAVNNRLGLFREANGGTLFLDEIGELPLALQVKLLRALQEHEVTPVGGSKGIRIDVRIVAATNKNLEEEVRDGRFREDLFFRLNVIRIALPSLRERRSDLPLLIPHFLQRFSAADGKAVRKISPQAMRVLVNHTYPGNIRELENVLQYAVTMAQGETIQTHDLPSSLAAVPPACSVPVVVAAEEKLHFNGTTGKVSDNGTQVEFFSKGISLDTELEEYEQRILRAALEKAGGVQKRAAEELGINYRSLRHRLQKYHLT